MPDDTTQFKTIMPPQVNVSICPESSGVSTAAAIAIVDRYESCRMAMKLHWADPEWRESTVARMRGKEKTEEHRKNLAKSLTGRKLSPAHRENLRLSHRGQGLGQHRSLEVRMAIGAGNKGKRRSQAVRARNSAAHTGELHSNWGKHLSAITRAKIGAAHRGMKLSTDARQKISIAGRGRPSPNRGKRLSVEHRAKLSAAHVRLWQDPAYRAHAIRLILSGAGVRPTLPEIRVRKVLNEHFPGEWRYTGDGDVFIGSKNPDFVNINGQKAVVEVFGDYWHGEKKTGRTREQEEARRANHFARYGFRCAIIWECETKDEDAVLAKVAAL